jgi:hypothetical protein
LGLRKCDLALFLLIFVDKGCNRSERNEVLVNDRVWHRIKWLSLAGLIPFMLLTLSALFANSIEMQMMAVDLVCLYALSIVSFVGAISFGLVLGHPALQEVHALKLLTVSVLPGLIGCAAALLPGLGRPVVLCLACILCFVFDRIYWPDGPDRARWLRLRSVLTLGAVVHLAVIIGLGIYWALLAGAAELLNRAG